MKKIKTYIVFKNYMMSGLADVYYVGRSKRIARKEFRQLAGPFMLNRYVDTTKLVLAEVDLDKVDYDFLSEEYDNFNSQKLVNETLSSIVYDKTFNELCMINDKTFDLDFLPWYYNNSFLRWLKKYIKKNF